MKINKKIASLALAGVMSASLITGALAANNEVKYTGETQLPTIKVTLPTAAKLGLNPYRMTYSGSITAFKNAQSTEQVIFAPAVVQNQTDAPLKVSLNIKPVAAASVVLVSASSAFAATVSGTTVQYKAVVLNYEIGRVKTKTGLGTASASKTKVAWLNSDAKTTGALLGAVASTTSKTAAQVLASKGADFTTTEVSVPATNNDPFILPDTKGKASQTNYFAVNFTGSANQNANWGAKDTLGVTLTYTFQAMPNPAPAAS